MPLMRMPCRVSQTSSRGRHRAAASTRGVGSGCIVMPAAVGAMPGAPWHELQCAAKQAAPRCTRVGASSGLSSIDCACRRTERRIAYSSSEYTGCVCGRSADTSYRPATTTPPPTRPANNPTAAIATAAVRRVLRRIKPKEQSARLALGFAFLLPPLGEGRDGGRVGARLPPPQPSHRGEGARRGHAV